MGEDIKKTLQSVEHALDVLEAFSSETSRLTLKEIAEKTHIHKSSVYRIVSVLKKRGYLEKNAESGRYSLGLRLVGLASNRINDLELVAEAHPLLMRLHSETSLTAQLCVLEGTEVIYIDEVSGTSSRRYMTMGNRGEAYCSSLGKCLLAALSGEALEARFENYTFIPYTDTTITSFDKLKEELRTVRKNGYALNSGEHNPILSSIACPVYDYNGNVIAAVSLGGAKYLFVPETIQNLLAHLQRYTLYISKRFGYEIDVPSL